MSINVGNYKFEGAYNSTEDLKNQSGVYVILGRNNNFDNGKVVDIGESEKVRERVENHDRSDCWTKQRYSQLEVAALYCNEQQRMEIEQQLRQQYNPPCGEG